MVSDDAEWGVRWAALPEIGVLHSLALAGYPFLLPGVILHRSRGLPYLSFSYALSLNNRDVHFLIDLYSSVTACQRHTLYAP